MAVWVLGCEDRIVLFFWLQAHGMMCHPPVPMMLD